MRKLCLKTAGLIVLMALAGGCGGSPAKITTVPPPACTPSSKPEFAYVLNGFEVDTISMYTVDSCTGSLQANSPATIPTGGNQFGSEGMVVDPTGRFAYVANLISNATDLATISMFTINISTGLLTPTSPATIPTGFFPQGIAIDPSGKFVYTANSDDNTVSMFTINQSTGVLTPTTPPTVATGWSPLSVTVDPSGRFAYVSNQDDDTESMYTINANTGVLMPTTPATVPTAYSPFQGTADPSGKFFYVPNEGGSSVSEYTIDSTTGVLTPTTEIEAATGNGPTSVAVDPSSHYAYVVNRMDNTISMFTIDTATGNLAPNGTIPTGSQPFPILIDPSGKFAYVGDESGTVSIYMLGSDGSLTPAGVTQNGGSPVSVAVTKAQP